MSDWLSIIIVILIVGIVLDGIRRARNARKNELKLSKNARKADLMFEKEAANNLSSELPHGGARSKQKEADEALHEDPVQESLELDEPVPMLMESVAEENSIESEEQEELFSEPDFEPQIGELSDLEKIDDEAATDVASENDGSSSDQDRTDSLAASTLKKASKVKNSLFASTSRDVEEKTASSAEEVPAELRPEEILIVNIMAKNNEAISGKSLLDVFSTEGLKYGQMGIFHRHLNNDGDGPVVYSIANIVEPGSFNFAEMKNETTPGVCIFLSLPTAGSAISAYDDMIDTARTISAKLGCELSDENRSILTKQTIEHGRQRVIEFERKNKLRKHT